METDVQAAGAAEDTGDVLLDVMESSHGVVDGVAEESQPGNSDPVSRDAGGSGDSDRAGGSGARRGKGRKRSGRGGNTKSPKLLKGDFTGGHNVKKFLDQDIHRPLSQKVFLGNLPYEMDWKELKEIIRDKVGKVALANIAQDGKGRSAGIGLAEFNDDESAKRCIQCLNGSQVGSRKILARKMKEEDVSKFSKLLPSRIGKESGPIFSRIGGRPAISSALSRRLGPFGSSNGPFGPFDPLGRGNLLSSLAAASEHRQAEKPSFGFHSELSSFHSPFGASSPPVPSLLGSQRSSPPFAPSPFFSSKSSGFEQGSSGPYGSTHMSAPTPSPSMDRVMQLLREEKVLSEHQLARIGISADTLRAQGIEFDQYLTNQVFVGNLPYDVTERKLKEVFSLAGTVIRIRLPPGKEGHPAGYAIVTYDNIFEALQAIHQFNRQLLYEREMRLRIYLSDDLGYNPRDNRGRLSNSPQGVVPLMSSFMASGIAGLSHEFESASARGGIPSLLPHAQIQAQAQALAQRQVTVSPSVPLQVQHARGDLGLHVTLKQDPFKWGDMSSVSGGPGVREQMQGLPYAPPRPTQAPAQDWYSREQAAPLGRQFQAAQPQQHMTAPAGSVFQAGGASAFSARAPALSMSKQESTTLIVKNLPSSYDVNGVKRIFRDVATILNAEVFLDAFGRSMGIARIHCASQPEAARAYRLMNGARLDANTISIEFD